MAYRSNSDIILPLITNECNTSILNKTSKISTHALKINEDYKKTFEKLQNAHSSSLQQVQKVTKVLKQDNKLIKKLDTLIDNLDVVSNETRFFYDFLRLKLNSQVKGYIDKDNMQFFEISVKGQTGPLRIIVKVKKGKVQSFISFKNSRPDRISFDYSFESELIEIHGKYATFIENNCYLGVYALEGSSIVVKYFFQLGSIEQGNRNMNKSNTIAIQCKKEREFKYDNEIKELRNNPQARLNFDKKIEKILEDKRKKRKKLDYVQQNKTNFKNLEAIKESFTKKKNEKEKKIESAQQNKALLYEEKCESLKIMMVRKDVRIIAENKAKEIQGILFRKNFFEKN